MSYTFSRRSFLKYSALTAVLVAGAGMLSACEISDPDNPVSKSLGQSIELNNVKGTLKSIENGVFNFRIDSSYGLPLRLDPDYFNIKVLNADGNTEYYSGEHGNEVVLDITEGAPKKPRLYSGEYAVLDITAPGEFPASLAGKTVIFQYIPVRENSQLSMSWSITYLADESSSSDGSSSSSSNSTSERPAESEPPVANS